MVQLSAPGRRRASLKDSRRLGRPRQRLRPDHAQTIRGRRRADEPVRRLRLPGVLARCGRCSARRLSEWVSSRSGRTNFLSGRAGGKGRSLPAMSVHRRRSRSASPSERPSLIPPPPSAARRARRPVSAGLAVGTAGTAFAAAIWTAWTSLQEERPARPRRDPSIRTTSTHPGRRRACDCGRAADGPAAPGDPGSGTTPPRAPTCPPLPPRPPSPRGPGRPDFVPRRKRRPR